MIPRQGVFDTYWRFASARQEIFFRRVKNLPPPWTTDQILSHHKFCNTYRASDRVSQYLIRNVIYSGCQNEEEVLFRILLFKLFNKIETWQHLERRLGIINLAGFNFDVYANLLKEVIKSGNPVYTSAYMSCASKAFGYDRKHENHLALIDKAFNEDHIATRIIKARSLEDVYQTLLSYPLIGKFMAYQLAIDINYSEVVNFRENSFTVAGPGAERGIRKCFVDVAGKSDHYIINWMVENQEREFQRLGIRFRSLWGRPLQCIDCQGLFCETDKYCRVAFPELKSNRTRIKAKFRPNWKIISYFFPPKWKINRLIEADSGWQEVDFLPQVTDQQLLLGL